MAKRVKNYLITGFSGFVSRYFFEYLNKNREKTNVLGIDIIEPSFDLNYCNNINTKFIKIGLLDKNKIRDIILKFQPDFILHLASFSSVAFSWQQPIFEF